jgi:hypothetical protein
MNHEPELSEDAGNEMLARAIIDGDLGEVAHWCFLAADESGREDSVEWCESIAREIINRGEPVTIRDLLDAAESTKLI